MIKPLTPNLTKKNTRGVTQQIDVLHIALDKIISQGCTYIPLP